MFFNNRYKKIPETVSGIFLARGLWIILLLLSLISQIFSL